MEGLPVNYDSAQNLPQLHCPCCTGNMGTGTGGVEVEIPTGCQEVRRNVQNLRDAFTDVQKKVDDLKGNVVSEYLFKQSWKGDLCPYLLHAAS